MIPEEEPKAAPAPSQLPAKGHRRSRRGGRRHSKRREERPPASTNQEAEPADNFPPGESNAPASDTELRRRQRPEPAHKTPGVTDAIEQVTQVIEELKHALDEMEEVLETLELAERQKIDDEREIESLQRALRQLHRSGHSSGPSRSQS
jgi:hypothetical protein